MTTLERVKVVGAGVDRIDGPHKVTGAAKYPNDFIYPGLCPRGAGAEHHRGGTHQLHRHHRRRVGAGCPHRHHPPQRAPP